MENLKSFFYLKLFFISIIGALTIGLISLYYLVRISDLAVENYRYGYLMYIAKAIEKSNNYRPISKINVNKVNAPPAPTGGALNLLKITEFGPDLGENEQDNPPKLSLWLVGQEGTILSSTTAADLPIEWKELKLPKKIHEIVMNEIKFGLGPKTFVIKLDTTPGTYLISHNARALFQGPYLIIQGTHTFTTAALAVFIALSISFYYLRKKSHEEQLVSGRLVKRLKDTEISRSNLLQELGHDLRTPLTSLNTAFETMREHSDVLSFEERNELFSMIATDIRYFKDLLEKLTLISTIDGPHYKSSTEKIHLSTLLENEIQSRKVATGESLEWKLIVGENSSPVILGDSHLITRLFRNAFDNAARYATEMITININDLKDQVEILIQDDGPGLTHETLETFGKRRERRHRKEKGPENFSLGLGSIIMKTIAQVHGGQLEILNLMKSGEIQGACLKVTFQKL